LIDNRLFVRFEEVEMAHYTTPVENGILKEAAY
jgi:hypothetical protein